MTTAGFFPLVAVDPKRGTIVWPNGADLAPDVLYARAMDVAQSYRRVQ